MVTEMTEQGRYPHAIVAAALVNTEGNIFLARSSKEKGGLFTVPGGHIQYGERISEALCREIREEMGLILNNYKLIWVGEGICLPSYRDGAQHLIYLVFLCDKWSGEIHLDGRELSDGLWVKPEDALTDLPLADGVRDLMRFLVENSPDMYGITYDEKQSYLLCIGHFGLDYCYAGTRYLGVSPGGAALRGTLAAALFGVPVRPLTCIGSEREWKEVLALLTRLGVDSSDIHLSPTSLSFHNYYDDELHIDRVEIRNDHMMDQVAGLVTDESINHARLVAIFPLALDEQRALIQRTAPLYKPIALVLHFSRITPENAAEYLELVTQVDYLFLNLLEAELLLGEGEPCEHAQALARRVQRAVILSQGENGCWLARPNVEPVHFYPAPAVVYDVTGAGDMLAGGVLAGVYLGVDMLTAVRLGQLVAALSLGDLVNRSVLSFLANAPEARSFLTIDNKELWRRNQL